MLVCQDTEKRMHVCIGHIYNIVINIIMQVIPKKHSRPVDYVENWVCVDNIVYTTIYKYMLLSDTTI